MIQMDIGQAYVMACQRLGAALVENGVLAERIAELEAKLAAGGQNPPGEPAGSVMPQ